ncbi:MAG: hypothetical protein Q9212_005289 [Teloschistes hypoglaucus]
MSEDREAWSSNTHRDGPGSSRYGSTIETPSMNPHNDLISFLAVAQFYEIDIISVSWEKGRGQTGSGATSNIWQSSHSRSVDFAFKRTKLAEKSLIDKQDEERAFNAFVSEISVLRHPLIEHHQNIVNLEGISWDVPARSERVWPVLILEKSQLGDLESFMRSEQGRATTMHQRLGFCSDVANALIALHSSHMSHGDVKPSNALIFKDGDGESYAKLADYGYAGWAIGSLENTLVFPPRSWPWDAPEYHHRGFTVPTAQKMDAYSFGLLCLWVLFFDKQSLGKCVSQWPLNDFELLDCMKHEDTLTGFACSQVESTQSLSAGEKADLIRFFVSTITLDPKERATNFKDFITLLGYRWYGSLLVWMHA